MNEPIKTASREALEFISELSIRLAIMNQQNQDLQSKIKLLEKPIEEPKK